MGVRSDNLEWLKEVEDHAEAYADGVSVAIEFAGGVAIPEFNGWVGLARAARDLHKIIEEQEKQWGG